ncbi:MAG: 2-oxoacid:acceptor oxidoreductase subunit alpha, partial [Bacteroidales bacterium]|nr:2-oxoacid:acceptor oxidoreductase subunit alpha [Bacteroidales bacterium]
CIVMAASSPANCFNYAFKAAKLALEHMTPVILLTDSYLANGSQLWKIPEMKKMPDIKPPRVPDNAENYYPYHRDPERLNRYWAIPGQPGLRHRVGGLEKADITGEVSHDPMNHQIMVEQRDLKVKKVADFIPRQEVIGPEEGDLLVVGWGGSYGAMVSAVKDLRDEGKSISLSQFNYINPLPHNTAEVFSKFKKILVCELNLGQFASYLRSKHPGFEYLQYNKVQGLPLFISELKMKFNEVLESI